MFTGREYDAETGLYFYRARYYSPELGRFLQTDPLEIDDENTYTYCYNDPVNYSDPYGLLSLPLPIPLPIAGGGGIPLGDDPHRRAALRPLGRGLGRDARPGPLCQLRIKIVEATKSSL